MFALIRVFSGHPVVDAVKLALYRPSFYRAGGLTQEAMRGPSQWSVADRELMAAFVSKVNETEFCIAAHTATSAIAYNDGAKVSATLTDLETAPVTEPLRATLRMLGKLTRESKVDADDMRKVLAAGASEQQIKDALAVVLHDLVYEDGHRREPAVGAVRTLVIVEIQPCRQSSETFAV